MVAPDDDATTLQYIDGAYASFPADNQDDDIIEASTPYPIKWRLVVGMGLVALSFLYATASQLAPPNHKERAAAE